MLIQSLFIAKLKSLGKTAVVKFVARYGTEVRQLLAETGMAPRLLFCGPLYGPEDIRNDPRESSRNAFGLHLRPVHPVVMEHIGETCYGEAPEGDDSPSGLYARIEAMADKLHESDYVSGDLRPLNAINPSGGTFLTDFCLTNMTSHCSATALPRSSRQQIRLHYHRT